ncbi:MAG: VOC family protein [Actinobacteria bacterium]|nr:VOC family protein [Actinomycetota bacterium]
MKRRPIGHVRSVSTSMPNGIVELALEASDLDSMVAFYQRLGLAVVGREPGRIWMSAGPAARLGIWSTGAKEHRDRGGMHVHFALGVSTDALDAAIRELDESGLDFKGPVTHDDGDRSIYVFDPEGNRVELWDVDEVND